MCLFEMPSYSGLAFLSGPGAMLLALAFLSRRWVRLRHIPGPFLASLTDFWLAFHYWRDVHYEDLIAKLHERYGPIVRTGPSRLSFASPAAIPEIYGTKKVYAKADTYRPMTVIANGKEISSLITLRDEKRFATIKRHVASGFSQSGFLKQEPQIDKVLSQFLELLKASENDDYVHLSKMFRWWTFDTINQVAFSDDLGYMTAGADLAHVFEGVGQRFMHWKLWYVLPNLEWLLFKSPVATYFQKTGSRNILTNVAMKRIAQREHDDEKSLESDLLGKFLAASRNDPANISKIDVVGLTLSTVHAGADTVSSTTALVLINLLKNQDSLARLEEELLPLNLPTPPSFETITSLPYLDAVIRESLRVTPTAAGSFERKVPAEGATICGLWVPGGIEVSASLPGTQMSAEIYGQEPEVFKPERWIECDRETFYSMDKHHLGFSHGRRVCLGIHLARMEMKKALASLVTVWKISLAEEPKVGWHMNTRAVDLKVRLERR